MWCVLKISVIIPVHNGERYLGEAIRSVLDNGAAVSEILVVDDGSSDDSAGVAESFSQVRVIRQRQAGAGAARHLGVEHSREDWLAFLDADDLWLPHKLDVQRRWLEAHPRIAGVFGSAVQFASPDWSSGEAPPAFDGSPQPAQLPGTLLLRRSAYAQAGPFSTQYRAGEFIDWYLRAEEAGCQFGAVPEVVLRRRLHARNSGRLQPENRQDYARIILQAMRRRRALAQTSGNR